MAETGVELKLDRDRFLAHHWQQRPLLIRGAIAGFTPPLSRHELAGLALEAVVESRIIESVGGHWSLSHGPFTEADYQRPHSWTLLVQAVDHYIDSVAELRRLVDFLPGWRVDDVMVSYAVDGGSVGPHYDNYDVFLLQGEGRRRWTLGQYCDASSPLLDHDELRILRDFQPQETYVLDPGDILYVPPGVAHWGIAEGECTTFSIGFRAPRVNELLSRFVDDLLDNTEPELFYRDPGLAPATRAGEIRPCDLERVRTQLQAALEQGVDMRWFGELVTEPRYPPSMDTDDISATLQMLQGEGHCLHLAPEAKLAWQQQDDAIAVFANGDSRVFPNAIQATLTALCDDWVLPAAALESAMGTSATRDLMHYLVASGCVYVE